MAVSAELDWLASVGLPARWRGLARFVVLDANRSVAGHLETINAWRRVWQADAHRCAELHVIVVDERARSLTPNIHRLSFDDGACVALVVPTTLVSALAELIAQVDVFRVDARPGTGEPPDPRAWKSFARLAVDGASLVLDEGEGTAATNRAEHSHAALRAALVTAGFRFEPSTTRTRAVATFEARDPRRRQGPRHGRPTLGAECGSTPSAARDRPRAIVIGAGLAGCATAWALAERGWRSTLVDTHDHLAAEASGNPAGLFHGIFNRQDGRHARFNRAASLEAAKAVRIAIDAHGAHGAVDGVIRIERTEAGADVLAMRASIAALGLPLDYVEALDARRVSDAAGLRIDHPGWLYRGGGWVDPAALARSFFARARGFAATTLGRSVASLRRVGSAWQLLDGNGQVIDQAETLVLANAHDAVRLLDTIDGERETPEARIDWPLQRVRGQVSVMRADAWPAGQPPRLPLTGAGYVLAITDRRVMFGSTAQPDDNDGAVRVADHAANLERLDTWLAGARAIDPSSLEGRTAWRCVTTDRMPVIGAVPVLTLTNRSGLEVGTGAVAANRLDQPRFVPREPGLFVHSALGSRGITWAALGGETLAALITGAPCPIEASLVDAIDPARFLSRHARRGG